MELSNFELILNDLLDDLQNKCAHYISVDDTKNEINKIYNSVLLKFINNEMSEHLFLSDLQNIIMLPVHEKVFSLICEENRLEDQIIYHKCCELSALKVTSDQLGAMEDFSIPLPATIVELASLDMHQTPLEKLNCFATAFDLTMAELKGAIIDVFALSCDHKIPTLSVSDITPILATIIIHTKPLHLISNLRYVEHFNLSQFNANESECISAFKTAIDKLKVVTVDVLLPRSIRIYCDISLSDVLKLTGEVDEKYDRDGHRISSPSDPLDRHIEQFTNLISASTLGNTQNY